MDKFDVLRYEWRGEERDWESEYYEAVTRNAELQEENDLLKEEVARLKELLSE